MPRTVYFCSKCQLDREAVKEGRIDKIRRFRSGFVAVFLTCGHKAPVSSARIELDPPRDLTDNETRALYDRLKSSFEE